MKNCRNCGQQIDDNAIFCHRCGQRTNGDAPNNPFGFDPYSNGGFGYVDTKESRGIAILSFIFWQVGVVLWFFWRNTRPGKARSAIKGTLAGATFQLPVLGVVLWFLWRNDSENRELARVGLISAIVGAALSLVSSVILTVLSSLGLFDINQFMSEFMYGADAAFNYFRFLR
jgi:hypothetical protein